MQILAFSFLGCLLKAPTYFITYQMLKLQRITQIQRGPCVFFRFNQIFNFQI